MVFVMDFLTKRMDKIMICPFLLYLPILCVNLSHSDSREVARDAVSWHWRCSSCSARF